ncbi:MAG: sialate O-acetylesterase [Opitutaceae bacterium]|jgi:sialate O-acetylesterase
MMKRLICLALVCLGAPLRADVTPAVFFTDNAVLQRDKPLPIWGTAAAGERVSVTFAGQTASSTADAHGQWLVRLAPIPATVTPSTLVIKGNNTVTLGNILVGEVWLASGQSNMEFSVRGTQDAVLDIPSSAGFPLIRHIKIGQKVADSPITTATGKWEVAGPKTTGNFTAVGYFFALDIYQILRVPVGIINSSWGGSRIEAWMDPATIKSAPSFASITTSWAKIIADYPVTKIKYDADLAKWQQEQTAAKAANQPFTKRPPGPVWGGLRGPGHFDTPSGLYNGMINPLVPYALRGALWYQGESNTGNPAYAAYFSAMITGWRRQFGQDDFSFYWVQLANYKGAEPQGTEWAFLREAQTKTLALPFSGQAVIIDLGNVRDIHPRNKRDVGRRLARLALKRDYGINVADIGPLFAKAVRDGAAFRISFTEINGGLIAPQNELGGFELAGADKIFHAAEARIDGDTIVVSNTGITDPVAVRYAWRNAPLAGLFNKEGLPAVPFRTDNW